MKKLFENLWVKLAALVLAVLLWFHVVTDKTYQNEIALPLKKVDLAEDLALIEPPPDSITVNVSATGKSLLRTDWKKRGLRLVVDRSRPGRFTTDVSTANLSLVKAEKVVLRDVISPREIAFSCDWKSEKEVPILSRITVLPDEGYAAPESDSIVPSTAIISGPKRALSPLEYVETERIVLEGVRNSFSREVALLAGDTYGLKIEPDSAIAYINVYPVRRKVISGVTIELINAPRHKMFDVVPKTIELRVAGKAGGIDSLTADRVSAIADYVLANAAGVIPVQVVLPPSISLLYKSTDSVRLIEQR
jgi:YbbR domain-containing protein